LNEGERRDRSREEKNPKELDKVKNMSLLFSPTILKGSQNPRWGGGRTFNTIEGKGE